MSVELLPCPFCGSTNVEVDGHMPYLKSVDCFDCGASGATGGHAEAIADWNRRAPLDKEPSR